MNAGEALDWGICGVGVLPFDLRMRDAHGRAGLPLHAGGEGSATAAGSPGSSARSSSTCSRPDDPEAVIEKMADAGHPDRLADRHRGRLQRPSGDRRVRRRQPGGAGRPGAGARRRRTTFGLITEALARRRDRGHDAVHGHVLRQHPGQRPCRRRRCSPPSPGCAIPELGDWVAAKVPFPNSHGGPDHPGHHRRGPGRRSPSGSASRTAGRWSASRSPSGCWRTTSRLGRPAVRGRRGAGGRRRRAVRADEAAAAQRQPPGAVLLRLPGRATGWCTRWPRTRCSPTSCWPTWIARPRPTLAPVPGIDLDAYKHQLIERFSNAARPRHRRPAVRRELRPDPEVAAAGHPGEPGRRAARSPGRRPWWPAGRATPRASTSRASRSRSSTGWPTTLTALARAAARGPARLRRQPGAVRRPGRRSRAFTEPYLDDPGVACTPGAPGPPWSLWFPPPSPDLPFLP